MFNIEYKDIDRIKFGDTEYRLAEAENGQRVIHLWSSLSKQWVVSSRINVNTRWYQMKVFYEGLAKRRSKNKEIK